jgi:hypothetical protein
MNGSNAVVNANQTLVNPGSTDVINPATEVNSQDQSNVAATSDGSNMMLNFGNNPSLQNPNPQAASEQFSSLIPGNNEMISKDAAEFQQRQMDQGLEWNEQTQNWVPNKQLRKLATAFDPNASKPQDFSSITNTSVSGTADYANSNPKSSAPAQTVVVSQPAQNNSKYGDLTNILQAQKVAGLLNKSTIPSSVIPDLKNNSSFDYSNTRDQLPLVRNNTPEEPYVQDNFDYPYLAPQKNGGSVDPRALSNAINLINRAFGGMIPKALDGMNLGSEDKDANKIPDYLQFENLPATPFNSGTLEQSAGKKMNIDWNQVGAAAGDMYMNSASRATDFLNKMNAYNPEREQARYSAMNRSKDSFESMDQGLYDQSGNFIPNSIGNQVLNPTDSNYSSDKPIFAYGGRIYEIGGDVDLDDDEMEQLAAAGFKFSRV